MATNKHALVRYHKLDECFSNPGRNYGIPELIEACNAVLTEMDPDTKGISRRQIYDDIAFMESSQGWSVELEKIREGKRVYYQYSDPHFSIKNQMVNPMEAEQLRSTFLVLARFKGMPQFEWIEEMQVRLEDALGLKETTKSIVGFQQNPYLKGLSYFNRLFNAIFNEQALQITYQGFKQEESSEFDFHPWYLKQYNDRWFLFGIRDGFESLTNLALDRIIHIEDSSVAFVPNTKYDFEELFEDVVGVSVNPDEAGKKVVLKVALEQWPYIKSKPIHGSQKIKETMEDGIILELDVQLNHEIIALLFSFMNTVEVLKPKELRDHFKEIAFNLYSKYI
ncbi:helix-turn-helix transcriptional regulator [Eudoraea adriatica]|uniref:helix-turn-helix transcriptional regulator n=1 Tax=Eudoraea adriatica TaxID=446681 RepID=UPI000369EE7B|nr:WYL domain-containing protein [Eudoraea adriatica]